MKGRKSFKFINRTRFRGFQDNDEDGVNIDFTKDVNLITYEILKNVCQKSDIPEEKYLAYLNVFIKLLKQYDQDYFTKLVYSTEDVFICLRITLLHESSLVRAAGLRTIRYIIKSEQHVSIINKLQYPALISRSLDLILYRNDSERVQALRLVRQILIIAPHLFHISVARSIASVALGGKTPLEKEDEKLAKDRKVDFADQDEDLNENDRMVRCFIAVLVELSLLNVDVFLECDGVRALIHGLQVARPGRMTESILGALLNLLNDQTTRAKANLNFQFVAASFTDVHYLDRQLEKKSLCYESGVGPWYHVLLISLLRSHIGTLYFCHPEDSLTLKSFVSTLYLNNLNVRKSVLEVLYELLGLPQPEWSDEFSVILQAVDPSRFQESFKVSEGFVAKEAKVVLPHVSKCRVNISEVQMSLILYSLLEADILNSLIYVIVSEDTLLSVSATILLGEIMYLVHKQLPPECYDFSPSVTNLVSYAVRGRPTVAVPTTPTSPVIPCASLFSETDISRCSISKNNSKVPNVGGDFSTTQVVQNVIDILQNYSHRSKDLKRQVENILNSNNVEVEFCPRSQQRATTAITSLSALHKLFRRRPAPSSIFLDQVICHVEKKEIADNLPSIISMKGKNLSKNKIPNILTKECEEAIKDSYVWTKKDNFAWNWEAIRSVFKIKMQPECKLEDITLRPFIKKIIEFLSPQDGHLSRCDLSSNLISLAAIDLIKFLLHSEDMEGGKYLQKFITDINIQLDSILTSESAHECLLSPKNVTNTLCQHYFLFLGVISSKNVGLKLLKSLGVIDTLNKIVVTTNHSCYVKLILSSLDYTTSDLTRTILSNALSCGQESTRHYATQLLSILIRTRLEAQPDFLTWVIENLVNQLQDEKKAISLSALSSLDEACDNKKYLEAVITLRPSLLCFGDKGLLLLIRFLSTESGFTYLNQANFVLNQLERWSTNFNYRYVQLMEGEIHDALTLHKRTEDGHYMRRLSSIKMSVSDCYVLPHLYGQLAQHQKGFDILTKHDHLYSMFEIILKSRCVSFEEILELKAALWAIGNLATSPAGVRIISEQNIISAIVRLAEQCSIYSLRATAFYCLNLISTTKEGSIVLRHFGWLSVCHNRHENWPVVTNPCLSLSPDMFDTKVSPSSPSQSGFEVPSTESSEDNDHVPPIFIMGADCDMNKNFDSQWSKRERERRSATLPYKSQAVPSHHIRSFSESKAESTDSWEHAVEVHPQVTAEDISAIRLIGVCKKSRSDSCCTDSSTSGVSSCESTYGRFHILGEKAHQTLSPIPSTGSIATMNQSAQPKSSDQISEHINSSIKHRNSFSLRARLMHQHALSHSTFLSLRNLRPHPSASLSTLANIDLINFQEVNRMSPLVRPKLSAKYTHQPLSSEFEVTELPFLLLEDTEQQPLTGSAYPSSRSCISSPNGIPTFGEIADKQWSGPCYQGVCMPLNLAQLFPPLDSLYLPTSHKFDHIKSEAVSDQDCDCENDIDNDHRKKKYRHDRNTCLLCVVKFAPNRSQVLRNRKISTSSIHRVRTETESSYGGGVGISAGGSGVYDGESPIMLPWPQQNSAALMETTPASAESSTNDNTYGYTKALIDSSQSQSRSFVRKELLRLVELLSNPILFRTCKQGLLTIKQTCKDLFQDICVYSDVYNILSKANVRLPARRFLQDLFIDSTFNELHEESKSILSTSPCSTNDIMDDPLSSYDVQQHQQQQNSSNNSIDLDQTLNKSYKTNDSSSGGAGGIVGGSVGGGLISPSAELEVIMENEFSIESSTSAVIKAMEDNCGEEWCPESKSDYILENIKIDQQKDQQFDSVDDITNEMLYLKPSSSKINLDNDDQSILIVESRGNDSAIINDSLTQLSNDSKSSSTVITADNNTESQSFIIAGSDIQNSNIVLSDHSSSILSNDQHCPDTNNRSSNINFSNTSPISNQLIAHSVIIVPNNIISSDSSNILRTNQSSNTANSNQVNVNTKCSQSNTSINKLTEENSSSSIDFNTSKTDNISNIFNSNLSEDKDIDKTINNDPRNIYNETNSNETIPPSNDTFKKICSISDVSISEEISNKVKKKFLIETSIQHPPKIKSKDIIPTIEPVHETLDVREIKDIEELPNVLPRPNISETQFTNRMPSDKVKVNSSGDEIIKSITFQSEIIKNTQATNNEKHTSEINKSKCKSAETSETNKSKDQNEIQSKFIETCETNKTTSEIKNQSKSIETCSANKSSSRIKPQFKSIETFDNKNQSFETSSNTTSKICSIPSNKNITNIQNETNKKNPTTSKSNNNKNKTNTFNQINRNKNELNKNISTKCNKIKLSNNQSNESKNDKTKIKIQTISDENRIKQQNEDRVIKQTTTISGTTTSSHRKISVYSKPPITGISD